MEKSSSEESAIHRSPSVDSRDSDFAQASTSGLPFGGRGFTAGAFYGSTGPRAQTAAQSGAAGDDKSSNKYKAPKGSKYVVFYLDLSFVFLLEFKKCNMARGCLCCLKYMMFVFNLIFWVSHALNFLLLCSSFTGSEVLKICGRLMVRILLLVLWWQQIYIEMSWCMLLRVPRVGTGTFLSCVFPMLRQASHALIYVLATISGCLWVSWGTLGKLCHTPRMGLACDFLFMSCCDVYTRIVRKQSMFSL